MPRVGHAGDEQRRRRLPTRARAASDRGVAHTRAATRAASEGAGRTGDATGAVLRPRSTGAPCRRGGRRRLPCSASPRRPAARASSLGAHREAAAQYRRALRYSDDLPPEDRATLFERYSRECYLTDEANDAVGSLRSAVECYRELGDRTKEGATLSELAVILWCPGRVEESRQTGLDAVVLLEQQPPGAALALACNSLSFLHRMNADIATARHWSERAVTLVEQLDDPDARSWVIGGVDFLEVAAGSSAARESLERRIEFAKSSGLEEEAAGMMEGLVSAIGLRSPYAPLHRHIEDGLEFSRRHGNDISYVYFLAYRSRLQLELGQWTDAAESAEQVIGERLVSTFPRTFALVTLGLVRARRGDPDAATVLDQALALAEPTGSFRGSGRLPLPEARSHG